MEFCDFQVVFLWNFVIKYYARRQVLYLPLLPDLPAQTACEERKAIKNPCNNGDNAIGLVTESIASSPF